MFIIQYIINPTFKEEVMRYIITESRLYDIFEKYMESTYDLHYFSFTREFRVKEILGNIFGDLWEQRFFYAYQSEEALLKAMFGDDTNKLLLTYLRNKFPEVGIRGVGNSPPESLL
jgi:hypothetical protein